MKRTVYFETQPTQKSGSPATRNERNIVSSSSRKMDGPLSAYWVKFFKNAGFPPEVATKHAVIFSNNRIQPDMLPDLDKPSLKEMGITLMGDMIAILRYAKNVVEENSCKKILVNTEDSPSADNKIAPKPVVKKIVAKAPLKPATSSKLKVDTPIKSIKTASSSTIKPVSVVAKKKVGSVSQTSRMYADYVDSTMKSKTIGTKRKYDSDDDDEEEGIDGKWVHNETSKRLKNTPNNVEYKVIMPKATVVRSQKILKKAIEQNKTVFHRLGDSMVSSTTNIAESSNTVNPVFNVTGLISTKKDLLKKNSSVFNRLGNKDNVTDDLRFTRNLRNGNVSNSSHGILKTRTSVLGTKALTTKPIKKVGTMRADEEAHKKAVSERVKPIKLIKANFKAQSTVRNTPIARKLGITGRLASETANLPAKSRLGRSKQVTFNKMAFVNNVKKQGVFSRLGI